MTDTNDLKDLPSQTKYSPKSIENIDIHVTELFGCEVLRKYVKKVGKNQQITSEKEKGRGLRIILGSVPVCMVLSTVMCAVLVAGILYHPPPLLKELSESILVNLGKDDDSAIWVDQIKISNDLILVLKGEIERLKMEGFANFTREKQLRDNLDAMERENQESLTSLSSANEVIQLQREMDGKNQLKLIELQEHLEICMEEKAAFQKSLLDSEKREHALTNDLIKLKDNAEHLKVTTQQLEGKLSMQAKVLKEADEFTVELEKNLKTCKEDRMVEKTNLTKKLTDTNNTLTNVKAQSKNYLLGLSKCQNNLNDSYLKNENLEKEKKTLQNDLSAAKSSLGSCMNKNMDNQVQSLELLQEKEKLENDLSAAKSSLGNCMNKNMDHQVQSLELLQENEKLKKELKVYETT